MYRLLFTAVVTLTLVGSAFAQTPTAADADFNGNGEVDIPDFFQFADAYGSKSKDANYDAKFDLDGNGEVDNPDYLIFVDLFGQTASVHIPDANLRAVIADSLGKASGEAITTAEMATLTRLEAPNKDISDLTGLKHATNLEWLVLNSNSISDISALSGLTYLRVLDLRENAGLSGPFPTSFTGLDSLNELYLEGTEMCVPMDAAFQTWLQGINTKTGVFYCADFDLAAGNTGPSGITYANNRFYVVDSNDKVYAYGSSGERDESADFDLAAGNTVPIGITYANNRFYVVDSDDGKVYAYTSSGQSG